MDNPNNRMVSETRRPIGRPPKVRIEEFPPVPVEEVYIPVRGFVCPGCGRAMQPRIVDTRHLKRSMQCTLCPTRFSVTYNEQGRPLEIRKTS